MIEERKSNDLGLLLKQSLQKYSLSMRKLSQLTGIDTATISRIINGKRKATLEHLQKFADCLDIPMTVLLESAGYQLEQKEQAQTDLEQFADVIQKSLQSSNVYEGDFSLEHIDKKLMNYAQYSETEEGKDTIFTSFEDKIQKIDATGPFVKHLHDFYKKFRQMKGTPRELTLIGSALLYFIIPVDVIPDYLFPVGYLDDAVAVQFVLNLLSKE